MSNAIYARTHQKIDHETGEVTETSQTVVRKMDSEPDFVKMYLKDIARIQSLTEREMDVLCELLPLMDYDNKIRIVSGSKRAICQKLGMFKVSTKLHPDMAPNQPTLNSLNVILYKLCSKGILIKEDTGLYLVNPNLFGKGKWTDILAIRVRIDYDGSGRRIQSKIQR